MNTFKKLGLPALAVVLAACGVSDVQMIKETQATAGTAFTRALTDEYRAYAIHEAEVEYEYPHAAVFARKGLMAAGGEVPQPEQANAWPSSPEREKVLEEARGRLMGYLANGSTERVPDKAARAQVMFDCWVEEEAEGDQESNCRAEFLKLEPELAAKPMAQPMMPALPQSFLVLFDFNKADLNANAKSVVDGVIAAYKKENPSQVVLEGHADRAGDVKYNEALAKRRVDTVSAALQAGGVPAQAIVISSFGEDKPAVPTADNTREQMNRRVTVTLK